MYNTDNVFDLLELDSNVRTRLQQEDEDDQYYGLLTLDNINYAADWDYSLPTINSSIKLTSLKNNRVRNIQTFIDRFNNYFYPYFSQVDFNNLLIAGGSVMGNLLRGRWSNDIDLFIYGLTEEQAINKVATLISQIYDSYEIYKQEQDQEEEVITQTTQHYDDNIRGSRSINNSLRRVTKNPKRKEETESITIRNKNAITLTLDSGQEIQIILRLYKSVTEILHGFDLGSVAVGYDGQQVYFTSLGKFSYENLVNIIDPTRRSTTYETRLNKFLGRGFSIILPYLDITKLRTDNLKYNILEVAALPYFTFSYRNVKDNKISMVKLLKVNEKEIQMHDYIDSELSEYTIFYLNLRALVKGDNNYYYYNTQQDLDILVSPPYISPSRIIDYYDNLKERIYNKGTFDINIFSSYFSSELLPYVLQDIFLNKTNSRKLDELIELQKQQVLNKLSQLTPEHYRLRFLTKNPGTQINGSFNPIISNLSDWYGSYLRQ